MIPIIRHILCSVIAAWNYWRVRTPHTHALGIDVDVFSFIQSDPFDISHPLFEKTPELYVFLKSHYKATFRGKLSKYFFYGNHNIKVKYYFDQHKSNFGQVFHHLFYCFYLTSATMAINYIFFSTRLYNLVLFKKLKIRMVVSTFRPSAASRVLGMLKQLQRSSMFWRHSVIIWLTKSSVPQE